MFSKFFLHMNTIQHLQMGWWTNTTTLTTHIYIYKLCVKNMYFKYIIYMLSKKSDRTQNTSRRCKKNKIVWTVLKFFWGWLRFHRNIWYQVHLKSRTELWQGDMDICICSKTVCKSFFLFSHLFRLNFECFGLATSDWKY